MDEIIKTTIDAIKLKDLETVEEKDKKDKTPKKVELTEAIILQVVELIKAGMNLRDVKKSVISPGPQGQKYKLTHEQVRAIAEYRAQRYAELTSDTIEP